LTSHGASITSRFGKGSAEEGDHHPQTPQRLMVTCGGGQLILTAPRGMFKLKR
jgi:hypothetical protein